MGAKVSSQVGVAKARCLLVVRNISEVKWAGLTQLAFDIDEVLRFGGGRSHRVPDLGPDIPVGHVIQFYSCVQHQTSGGACFWSFRYSLVIYFHFKRRILHLLSSGGRGYDYEQGCTGVLFHPWCKPLCILAFPVATMTVWCLFAEENSKGSNSEDSQSHNHNCFPP